MCDPHPSITPFGFVNPADHVLDKQATSRGENPQFGGINPIHNFKEGANRLAGRFKGGMRAKGVGRRCGEGEGGGGIGGACAREKGAQITPAHKKSDSYARWSINGEGQIFEAKLQKKISPKGHLQGKNRGQIRPGRTP